MADGAGTSMNAGLLSVRVAAKRIEADSICTFDLVSTDGQPLPSFTAGAHIDIALPDGTVRPYSLCNHPAETFRYTIAVLKAENSRGGSQALHDTVRPGDVLRISAPRNNFALAPDAARSLLLAGGIGITPLLSMTEHLSRTGQRFELHYCTRSRSRTAFYDHLASAAYADRVRFHFDDDPPERRPNFDALLSRRAAGAHLYVCGPRGFIDLVLATAQKYGWPSDAVHYELFTAEAVGGESGAFDIKLARSGRTVHVRSDQTAVEALRDAGIEIATSCEQGVCGSCLTRVLDGIPDHRDLYLRPDEQARNDQFTPCCSRAKSQLLVLDL